jgi:glycosyltransferase involved in cell wall biosynthesis
MVMKAKLTIYVLGHYRPGAADGLAEFNYQNVKLLKNHFNFQFIEFDQNKEQDYYSSTDSDSVLIHSFGSKNLPFYKLSLFFKDWMKNRNFSDAVFHLNHIYNFNNYLLARLLFKARIPYLITPHDSYVYCNSFKENKSLIKRVYRDIFVHFIDKYVLDHASLIHALTNQCESCLRLLTNSPIMIVPNQVSDMNLSLDLSVIKAQVCFIGRSDIYQKGIDRALEGLRLFKKSGYDILGLVFKIVGPADTSSDILRHKLCEELALELGKDVIFTGRVDEDERNRILKESRAYLHLSRFEGFGISVIQALSAFKPVIVSRQVPTSGIISAYKAGYVVDTVEDIAKALTAVISLSEDEYLIMANNARRCYEENFSPGFVGPQLLKLYTRAASISE